LIIFATHFMIDRFRLARFWNWIKNNPWEKRKIYIPTNATLEKVLAKEEIDYCTDELWFYKEITATGYPEEVPLWLSVWLLIVTDNILHILINGLAIYYLG